MGGPGVVLGGRGVGRWGVSGPTPAPCHRSCPRQAGHRRHGHGENRALLSWEEEGLACGALQVPHPRMAFVAAREEPVVGCEGQGINPLM